MPRRTKALPSASKDKVTCQPFLFSLESSAVGRPLPKLPIADAKLKGGPTVNTHYRVVQHTYRILLVASLML